VCAPKKAAAARIRIVDAATEGLARYPDAAWQMVTFGLPHRARHDARRLVDLTLTAWRWARQRGPLKAIHERLVHATVRGLEMPHGAHGWHPHVHFLMLTDDWTEDDRQTAAATWRRGVERFASELFPAEPPGTFTPHARWGVEWSTPVRAGDDLEARVSYVAKLGLELTALDKPHKGKGSSRSHWEIMRDAVDRSRSDSERSRDVSQMREYEHGMKGRRLLVIDPRATAMAKVGKAKRELAAELAAEREGLAIKDRDDETVAGGAEEIRTPVEEEAMALLRRAKWRNPTIFADVLAAVVAAAAAGGPVAATEALDAFIRTHCVFRREAPNSTGPPVSTGPPLAA
jgi:hypothetical protein